MISTKVADIAHIEASIYHYFLWREQQELRKEQQQPPQQRTKQKNSSKRKEKQVVQKDEPKDDTNHTIRMNQHQYKEKIHSIVLPMKQRSRKSTFVPTNSRSSRIVRIKKEEEEYMNDDSDEEDEMSSSSKEEEASSPSDDDYYTKKHAGNKRYSNAKHRTKQGDRKRGYSNPNDSSEDDDDARYSKSKKTAKSASALSFLFSNKYKTLYTIMAREFPHLPKQCPPDFATSTVPDIQSLFQNYTNSATKTMSLVDGMDTRNDPKQYRMIQKVYNQYDDNAEDDHRTRKKRKMTNTTNEAAIPSGSNHGNNTNIMIRMGGVNHNIHSIIATPDVVVHGDNDKYPYQSLSFIELYHRLKKYYIRQGHCGISNDNAVLYQWCEQIRLYYHYRQGIPNVLLYTSGSSNSSFVEKQLPNHQLNPDRIELLNDIQFPWNDDAMTISQSKALTSYDPYENHTIQEDHDHDGGGAMLAMAIPIDKVRAGAPMKWDDRFAQLQQFKQYYGHTMVPRDYTTNLPLARWVNTQRVDYKKQRLRPDDRLHQLQSIGFIWTLPKYKLSSKDDADMFVTFHICKTLEERIEQCLQLKRNYMKQQHQQGSKGNPKNTLQIHPITEIINCTNVDGVITTNIDTDDNNSDVDDSYDDDDDDDDDEMIGNRKKSSEQQQKGKKRKQQQLIEPNELISLQLWAQNIRNEYNLVLLQQDQTTKRTTTNNNNDNNERPDQTDTVNNNDTRMDVDDGDEKMNDADRFVSSYPIEPLLTSDQIQKLNDIGFIWDPPSSGVSAAAVPNIKKVITKSTTAIAPKDTIYNKDAVPAALHEITAAARVAAIAYEHSDNSNYNRSGIVVPDDEKRSGDDNAVALRRALDYDEDNNINEGKGTNDGQNQQKEYMNNNIDSNYKGDVDQDNNIRNNDHDGESMHGSEVPNHRKASSSSSRRIQEYDHRSEYHEEEEYL